MLLDAMKYRNSFGDEVDLMSGTVRSNPREAKLWSYDVSDSVLTQNPKSFALTVICSSDSSHSGEYYANETITKMSKDASYQVYHNTGYIQINDWRLDCYFVGVAGIETDLYGVVKFTANFYAPRGFLWYRINAERYTLPSEADWGTGPTIASISSENVVATKIIMKPFSNVGVGTAYFTVMQTKNVSDTSMSATVNIAVGTDAHNKYFCIDSFRKKITLALSTSTNVTKSDGDYNITSEVNGIDCILPSMSKEYFFAHGKSPVVKCGSKNFAYESYAYITFYELRGMPEWITI